MDMLRQGIHLRGYAQKNPKQEYKRESFELFQGLLEQIKFDVVQIVTQVKVQSPDEAAKIEEARRQAEANMKMTMSHASASGDEALSEEESSEAVPRVGRNEPCPCGSGKKYKHCHGRLV